MSKSTLHLPLFALMLLLCGCAPVTSPQPGTAAPEVETMKITSFSFSHNGMSTDTCYSYTVTQETGGIRLYAELNAGNTVVDVTVDEAVLDELSAIAERCRLDAWDGFEKTNSMALDGEGFALSAAFEDGSSIEAGGSNAFPQGYREAESAIRALFGDLIEQYGELYPKTLQSDDLDFLSLNFFGKKPRSSFEFLARKVQDGRTEINLRMTDTAGEFRKDTSAYAFYGYAEGFPFEAVQSIVRAYDLPAWNGWDRTAENYNECEFFQIELGYASGESISAIGTVYPEGYAEARAELISLFVDFIERHGDRFIPWEG